MKPILIPPLAPLALILLGALYVYLSDGLPDDDAPRRAAALFPVFCFPLYFLFLIVNFLDFIIQRAAKRLYPIFFGVLLLSLAGLFFVIFYRPEIDGVSFLWKAVIMAFGYAVLLLLPMTLVRQVLHAHSKAEKDELREEATK